MGRFGWDHPTTKRTTLAQSMKHVEKWAKVYVQARAEQDDLDAKIRPLQEELDEIQQLWDHGIEVEAMRKGILHAELKDLNLRRRHISEFRGLFWTPDTFLECSRNSVGKMLVHQRLELAEVPVKEGHRATLKFLREVMSEVEVQDPNYTKDGGDIFAKMPDPFASIADEPMIRKNAAIAKGRKTTPTSAKLDEPNNAWGANDDPWKANDETNNANDCWWSDEKAKNYEVNNKAKDPRSDNANANTNDDSATSLEAQGNHSQDPIEQPHIPDTKANTAELSQAIENLSVALDPTAEKGTQCSSCFDHFLKEKMITNSCGHHYCLDCTLHMVKQSLEDESMFPPRCCKQNLLLEDKRDLFDDKIWKQYEERAIMHNDTSRLYCSDRSCAAYIFPNDHGVCRVCKKQTCHVCNKPTHEGPCDVDHDEALETLVNEKEWRRCSNCSSLVELQSGCNHMTCVCGYQFCYRCGNKWKTCHCPQYNSAPVVIGDHCPLDACYHADGWTRLQNDTPCHDCNRTKTYAMLECNACHIRRCGPCRKDYAIMRDHWRQEQGLF